MAFEFHKMGRPEEHTIHPVVAPPAAAAVAGLCRNRPLRHHAIMQMHAWLQLGQHCMLFTHASNPAPNMLRCAWTITVLTRYARPD